MMSIRLQLRIITKEITTYDYDETTGENTVVFTGVTSANGQRVESRFDINQTDPTRRSNRIPGFHTRSRLCTSSRCRN